MGWGQGAAGNSRRWVPLISVGWLHYIYEVAFSFFDQAYASTLTVVLLAALAIIAIGQFVILDKRIHYR